MKITKQHLEKRVNHLNELTGYNYTLTYINYYKKYSLTLNNGSEIKEFGKYGNLSAKEMELWVNGAIAGLIFKVK